MEWYIKAQPGLKTLGFALCYCELCVCTTPGKNRILGLYIDDMPVLGANSQAVQSTIQRISTLWEIEVLGDVGHILGLGVSRGTETIVSGKARERAHRRFPGISPRLRI
jgi:hypothetical protein